MDSRNCHQCGIQYSRNHLYKVEDKLKKNASCFKNAFVNDRNEFLKPKFCRECQKKWLKLETKRGDNIQKYIIDLKRESETNTEKYVTLVDDDHLAVAGPSGEKRKITITHYIYDKKAKNNSTVELNTENPTTEIQKTFSNNNDELKIDLNVTVNEEFLASTESVQENSDTMKKDLIVALFGDELLVPNDDQSSTSTKFEELNEYEITSAHDDDKIKNSKDAVPQNNINSIEKENDEELGGDYEHWLNLWKEMFCSEGWEGSPECRLKYKYVVKKLEEAKKNGFAKEDIKDYNYWRELMMQKFYSDESDEWAAEEMKFIVQKMKETKEENK